MWIHAIACFFLVGDFVVVQSSADEPTIGQEESPGKANCPVSLPQESAGECSIIRTKELMWQKGTFQLAKRKNFPMPLVNMSIRHLVSYHENDSFAKSQFKGYKDMVIKIKTYAEQWRKQHPAEITRYEKYKDMFKAFRSLLVGKRSGHFNGNQAFGDLKASEKYQFVSEVERVNDILNNWQDDGIFAEQRLSGCNPMVLRRVTDDSSDVGLRWSELKKTLNPNYKWSSAVQNASGNNEPLEEAIRKGNVYVLRYEVFDDMPSLDYDVLEHNPGRTLWPAKSPVALFAMNSQKRDRRLRPAAIQIDYKPDSPVFSPVNGGSWMLAKWVVQATDYAHSQMIEHLLKVHLFMEPFCVVLYRQLSSKHPLNQLLKYHCRGLLATNTIGSPTLVASGGHMDRLTAMGYKGTLLLMERGYKTLSWKDADFDSDIKKRGLDDKKMLPYFPYRDDSEFLLMAITRMAEDYVNNYYRSNAAVKEDNELQAFVNELSADGTGPEEGRGEVKDFPAVLNTRREVTDIVAKLIWLTSVQHAVVNYPVSDYGAFTPILPTKVYNDTRVPPGVFSPLNLPNVNISSGQIEVAMNVGAYHYDTLFDYYKELPDGPASKIIQFYHDYFKYAITPRLKYWNHRRLSDSHLSYPYLQYPWIPNGIQT